MHNICTPLLRHLLLVLGLADVLINELGARLRTRYVVLEGIFLHIGRLIENPSGLISADFLILLCVLRMLALCANRPICKIVQRLIYLPRRWDRDKLVLTVFARDR